MVDIDPHPKIPAEVIPHADAICPYAIDAIRNLHHGPCPIPIRQRFEAEPSDDVNGTEQLLRDRTLDTRQ